MRTSRVVEFVDLLRTRLPWVQSSRTELFFRALSCFDEPDGEQVYWAGRLVFCRSEPDIAIYDSCFSGFFENVPASGPKAGEPPQRDGESARASEACGPDAEAPQGQARLIARATGAERLRQADFAALDAAQRECVYALVAAMRTKPPLRRSRRRTGARKGVLHVGRTARSALRWLGEVGELRYAALRFRPRRCVLLLDISGSMRDYAEALTLYGYSLVSAMKETAEVFAMGTRLTRLTNGLKSASPEAAREKVADEIRDWQGGTRLGGSLKQFQDEWGRRGLVRGAVVIIASDGWESGETQMLAEQMARLRRLSHRLVWLNPHKSSQGYEPTAAGMRAALPHLDAFVGGASLQELHRLNEVIHELCSSGARACHLKT